MELFRKTNIDFLGKKWIFIGLSLVLTAAGFVSYVVKGGPNGGLKYGIDFTGGANITVKFAGPPPVDKIRSVVSAKIPGEISVQEISGQNEVVIGTGLKTDEELQNARRIMGETLNANFADQSGKLDFNNTSAKTLFERLRDPFAAAGISMSDQEITDLAKSLTEYRDQARSGLLTNLNELSTAPGVTPAILQVIKSECSLARFAIRGAEVVGPKIGGELRTKAILATLYALGGMLVYIAFRFEWIYGLAAVVATFHDVLITLGLFSLFGKEISLNVVAALLTLVGYSMNDTIVVFDRIRETVKQGRRGEFEAVVNESVNRTLSRTVLTSGLTFISAIALLIFGGQVLHGFSFALVCGIIVGTYSSIFVASPILIFWRDFAEKRSKKVGPAAA
ncbi:MAG: protein translocase subunit SecF [Bryobacteraceae bacterium]|nr:protein translocase subunit SecF [Bryobacteraceae bacterium]